MFRIVLVDDCECSRELLRQYCGEVAGLELTASFADPMEALYYAQDNPFEVAALDVMMPGMNGVELGKRLRELYPGLVLIFVTASKEFAFDAYELEAAGYLLKPYDAEKAHAALERATRLCTGPAKRVYLRTFGHFDVFVDGKPLCFSRQKSKEILAYLVDRRGGIATVDQIVAALWEDRAGEACVRACYQTAFKDLRKDLERAGVGEILMSNRNQKTIDTGAVECDYYDLLAGDRQALEAFPGQYMADYSWAEPTTAHCAQVKASHIYE